MDTGKVKMHEALQPLEWLSGRWYSDSGRGIYPTIPDFSYHETVEFICIGQPMLNYMSTSQHPTKQTPMHQERGFLRIKPGTDQVALIVSHNFGITSVEEGTVDPEKKEIKLKTTSVHRISFAKDPAVKGFERSYTLVGDKLEMLLCMETENTPMTEHLKVTYTKM